MQQIRLCELWLVITDTKRQNIWHSISINCFVYFRKVWKITDNKNIAQCDYTSQPMNYLCIIRKTLKGRKQTKMEGGQSDTYLRLTRVLSGLRVSVVKIYRDETKTNISARSQWPSSAVEYRKVFYCWGWPLWPDRNIHFRFVSSLYVLTTLTRRPDDALVSLR